MKMLRILLLVLAPYAQWRSAMLAIDEALRAAHPSVSPFYDPRALAHHQVVRTHGSNNLLALVVRETMPRGRTTDRVFALCLSDKCLPAKLHDKLSCEKGRWVELLAHMQYQSNSKTKAKAKAEATATATAKT